MTEQFLGLHPKTFEMYHTNFYTDGADFNTLVDQLIYIYILMRITCQYYMLIKSKCVKKLLEVI